MGRYQDDGTWIWTAVDPVSKTVLAHVVGARRQRLADTIVAKVKARILGTPFFVSDGLKLYPRAILKMYGQWTEYPLTGKRGRPRKPGLAPPSDLRYAQVVKHQLGGHLVEVERKVIFGKDIVASEFTTSFVERCNLTMRQDNKRLARKTLAFSKKVRDLDEQMTLYFAHFNLCRSHMSLKRDDVSGRSARRTPMMMLGMADHVWSLRELLTFPYHNTSPCN
ncbi:MAG: IS1 family transposase [Methanomassiliicoccales archaeon]|jgi:IS1 family transposase